jgi:hypothetical protein
MRKSIVGVVIAALALGLAPNFARAAEKTARQGLDDRMHAVNETVKKRELMKEALKGVSIETGVPLAEVESMHKHHQDTGPAGILVACVLADETKKNPDSFIKKHVDGAKWADLARENKVPIEKLDHKLDNLERHLTAGEKGKRRKD